jgi:ammonia channel protein AmtB
VRCFTLTQNRWRIDAVRGVRPLHGVCGCLGAASRQGSSDPQ